MSQYNATNKQIFYQIMAINNTNTENGISESVFGKLSLDRNPILFQINNLLFEELTSQT